MDILYNNTDLLIRIGVVQFIIAIIELIILAHKGKEPNKDLLRYLTALAIGIFIFVLSFLTGIWGPIIVAPIVMVVVEAIWFVGAAKCATKQITKFYQKFIKV